jgi:hypothetical protein
LREEREILGKAAVLWLFSPIRGCLEGLM